MGVAITTRPTQTMPLLRSLTRRSGAIAAINMALLTELVRLLRPQMPVRGVTPQHPRSMVTPALSGVLLRRKCLALTSITAISPLLDLDPPHVPRPEPERHLAQVIRAAKVNDLDVVDRGAGV